MAGQERDYYALLGVGRNASAAEIGRAYRRAARATHPDIHPDDSSAGERFTAVALAYETLSDPQQRASYDRTHPSVRPVHRVHVAVHRPTHRVAAPPVHLGRRRHLRADSATTAGTASLFELVTSLSRLIDRWPFP